MNSLMQNIMTGMRWQVFGLWMAALLSFGPQTTWAQSTKRQVYLAPMYLNDLRAMAMGNAYGPIARGEGALYYNPAGLAQYEADIKLEASLDAEASSVVFLQDLQKNSKNPTATDLDAFLKKYSGTTQQLRVQTHSNGVANFAKLGFGVGASQIDNTRYVLDFNNNKTPTNYTDDSLNLSQYTLNMKTTGVGVALYDGKLLIGGTTRLIKYQEGAVNNSYANVITTGKVNTSITTETYNGNAADFGMLYRMESLSSLRGMWSFTAQNLLGAKLYGTSQTLPVSQIFNFGFSLSPKLGPLEILLTAEAEDLLNSVEIWDPVTNTGKKRSSTQRSHYGAEIGLFRTEMGNHVLNLRVGRNRGLLTYGWELNLFSVFRLSAIRYQDDVGWSGNSIPQKSVAVHAGVGLAF